MPKKYDRAIKEEAFLDITRHIAEQGDNTWTALRKKYSDRGVPKSTFSRWVQTVKANLGSDQETLEDAAQVALQAGKHLPAGPSPSYVAQEGAGARKNLDFLARLDQLYGDAEILREFGMKEGRLVSPKYFSQSVHLRRSLLETALKAMSEVWDLQQMQRFYDTVLEEIAQESPECAQRILDRLKKLNEEIGMTYETARV